MFIQIKFISIFLDRIVTTFLFNKLQLYHIYLTTLFNPRRREIKQKKCIIHSGPQGDSSIDLFPKPLNQV